MGFEKHSNYNNKSSFSSVVFGSEKPVLEVELNEAQQIVDTKLHMLARAVIGKGASLTPLNDRSVVYNATDKKYTLKDCIAITENGWMAYIDEVSISVNYLSPHIYLEVRESVKTCDDQLREYGNSSSSKVVTNTMQDSRFPFETTRRKVITYSLTASYQELSDTETVKYIPIATYDSTNNVVNRIITNRVERIEQFLEDLGYTI